MEMEGLRERTRGLRKTLDGVSSSVQSAVRDAPPTTTDRAFNLAQVQQSAGPIFVALATVVDVIEPVADKVSGLVQTGWKMLEPYHPEDLFVALYGFLLVFFGGVYMTLVASFEAAHIFGWDRIKVAVAALYHEWTKARAAFERDNKVCCCCGGSMQSSGAECNTER